MTRTTEKYKFEEKITDLGGIRKGLYGSIKISMMIKFIIIAQLSQAGSTGSTHCIIH